jgi:glycosyltransferase involved in cell wall biosynthesis
VNKSNSSASDNSIGKRPILNLRYDQYRSVNRLLNYWATNFYKPLPEKIRNYLRPNMLMLRQHKPRPFILPKIIEAYKTNDHQPMVSIVTPSYNQGNYITQTIESVLTQNYPNIEYIVQDGASTDQTVSIIENRYREHLDSFESVPDRGQAHALNIGFRKSSGEIMSWLNSDDLLLPGAIAYMVNFFNQHPDVDALYGHRVIIDADNNEVGRWVLPLHSDEILFWNDFVPQETLFWRRSLWDKVGACINENYAFAMDWELLIRFIESGARIIRAPRFLGAFRVHATQKSHKDVGSSGMREMSRIRKKIHRREIGENEVSKNVAAYIILSYLFTIGYRLRLLDYG